MAYVLKKTGDAVADTPYLVALALIEQEGRRALPLAGRSQKEPAPEGEAPDALGRMLTLELLLRVWQRSDEGLLKRSAAAESLLLVELPMERLPEDLPVLKAAWLNSGDFERFRTGLQGMSLRAWTIAVTKFQPVSLTQLW